MSDAMRHPSDKAMQLAGETVSGFDCEDWPNFVLALARQFDILLDRLARAAQVVAAAKALFPYDTTLDVGGDCVAITVDSEKLADVAIALMAIANEEGGLSEVYEQPVLEPGSGPQNHPAFKQLEAKLAAVVEAHEASKKIPYPDGDTWFQEEVGRLLAKAKEIGGTYV